MPKLDTKSILIGAGPIIIGQACEFDYSGAQACKALKADGFRTILVNSNPATIMTDPGNGRCHLHRGPLPGRPLKKSSSEKARCALAHHGRANGAELRP